MLLHVLYGNSWRVLALLVLCLQEFLSSRYYRLKCFVRMLRLLATISVFFCTASGRINENREKKKIFLKTYLQMSKKNNKVKYFLIIKPCINFTTNVNKNCIQYKFKRAIFTPFGSIISIHYVIVIIIIITASLTLKSVCNIDLDLHYGFFYSIDSLKSPKTGYFIFFLEHASRIYRIVRWVTQRERKEKKKKLTEL